MRFALGVAHYLQELSDEAKRTRWEGWIREYWNQRLRGIPRQLSAEELKQMIQWALELDPVFDSVTEVLRASPAPNLGDGFFYYLIKDKEFSVRHPAAVAVLLEHLLPAASESGLEGAPFTQILDDLMDASIPPDQLRRIADSLLRLVNYISPRLREYIGRA